MELVPTFCGKDCGGNACPLLAEVEGGRVVRMRHNEAAGPFITGCRRGFALHRAHYAEDRLLRPLIRVGPRGSGEFREADWDEALALVAERIGESRARHGPASTLNLSSDGSTGALHDTARLAKRFLNCAGGFTGTSSNYSNGAARFVLPYLLGPDWTGSGFDAATMRYAKLIVLWGANVLETRLGSEMPARLLEAKRLGAEIIAIDPRRTETVERAATRWIPCKPGTDAAMMLATLHVLISEGMVDRDFVAKRAVGFEELESYVLGSVDGVAKTPEWAAMFCGASAADIADFARAYGRAKPALLLPGYSIQRVRGGEDPFRLAVALQLATGNFGLLGGSTGSINNRLPAPRVGTLSDLDRGTNPAFPILRWPDAILEGRGGGYPSDPKTAYVAGGNLLNQGGDAKRAIAAFDALDFVVCHEMFMTPTALRSDVVLPAASPLEKEDIGIPWHGNFLLHKRAILPGRGSARSDYGIFRELAERMGFGTEFSGGRDAREWIEAFIADSEILDRAAFESSGIYLAPDQERVGLSEFARDPAAHPLGTPSGKVELASANYARDTGYPAIPTWRGASREPGERGGAVDPRFPLLLVTPKRADRTHSQGGGERSVERYDQALWINPSDAAARGIENGARVTVSNGRGRTSTEALLTEAIMPGVVCLHEGRWLELDESGEDQAGSPNVLTDTMGTEPSKAPAMHGVPVDVDLVDKT